MIYSKTSRIEITYTKPKTIMNMNAFEDSKYFVWIDIISNTDASRRIE